MRERAWEHPLPTGPTPGKRRKVEMSHNSCFCQKKSRVEQHRKAFMENTWLELIVENEDCGAFKERPRRNYSKVRILNWVTHTLNTSKI